MKKRIISLLLVALMVACALPASLFSVFAASVNVTPELTGSGEIGYTGVAACDAFGVAVNISGGTTLSGYQLNLKWDPTALTVDTGSVVISELLPEATSLISTAKVSEGVLTLAVVYGGEEIIAVDGEQRLFEVEFIPKTAGTSTIEVEVASVASATGIIDGIGGSLEIEVAEKRTSVVPVDATDVVFENVDSANDFVLPVEITPASDVTGITGYDIVISWDPDKLTISGEDAVALNEALPFAIKVINAEKIDSGLLSIAAVSASLVEISGATELLNLTMNALCDGTSKVTVSVKSISVDDGVLENVAGGSAIVTVSCDHEHEIGDDRTLVSAPTLDKVGIEVSACRICGLEKKFEIPVVNAQPAELAPLPEGAIEIDSAGYKFAGVVSIVAGDNMTAFDLAKLGYYGSLADASCDHNYAKVFSVNKYGLVVEVNTLIGRPNGVKNDMVCPEGGYIISYNCNKAGHAIIESVNVGDKVTLYNIDLDAIRGLGGHQDLTDAAFTFGPAPEHDHDGEWVVVTEPTCTDEGLQQLVCSCGEILGEEAIPALGHVSEVVPGYAPTCTESGLTDGVICSVCGEVLLAQEVIPAMGHSYGEEITVPATLSAEGMIYHVCSVCGTEEVVKVLPIVSAQPETKIDLPAGAISITTAGYLHGNAIVILAGNGECTVADLTALGCGSAKDMNYFKVIIVDAEGKVVATNFTLGRPDGVKTDMVIPEGGYLIGYNANVSGYDVMDSIKVGDSVTLYNIALETMRGISGNQSVEGAGFAVSDHAHIGEWVITTAPTCTAEGIRTMTCSICGTVITDVLPALGHTEGEWKVTTEPTCTERGIETLYCAVCGEAYETRPVAALGHGAGKEVITLEPTCTEEGELTIVCSVCGEVLVVIPIAALGHTEGEWKVITEPTCTTLGEEILTCVVCGEILNTRSINALGHDGEWIVISEPTCTEDGEKQLVCSVCGEVLEIVVTDALGHTAGEWKVTAEPTCTEEGEKVLICSVCGEIIATESIKALGHAKGEYEVSVEPTCTEKGLMILVCEVCGEIIDSVSIDALGHTAGKWEVVVAPTCGSEGFMKLFCTVCGELMDIATISATGAHNFVWVVDVPASESASGLSHEECTVCGTTRNENTEIPQLSHTHSMTYVKGVDATCTKNGVLTHYHCDNCGKNYSDIEGVNMLSDVVIPAKGHTLVTDKAVQPTCTTPGMTEGSHCSVCGYIAVEQTKLPALGHNMVTSAPVAPTCTEDGLTSGVVCERCGEVLVATQIVPALGHVSMPIPAKPATCMETGLTAGTKCAICGEILVEQQVIEKLAHTLIPVAAQPATCTESGLTAGEKCIVCGEVTKEQQVIPAKGHIEYTVNATCTTDGYTFCLVCGVTTKEIPALGHDVVVIPGVAATCTSSGLTEGAKCDRCGMILEVPQVIEALGHSIVTVPGSEPTCDTNGKTDGEKCSVCGLILVPQQIKPATGHTYQKVDGVPATCTEAGLTIGYVCAVCDKVLLPQETIPALGHKTFQVDATCTTDGYIKCVVCGEIIETLSATGHDEKPIPAVDPTCTATGLTEGSYCTVCGATIVAQKRIPVIPHTFGEEQRLEPTLQKEGKVFRVCTVCEHFETIELLPVISVQPPVEDQDTKPETGETIDIGSAGYTEASNILILSGTGMSFNKLVALNEGKNSNYSLIIVDDKGEVVEVYKIPEARSRINLLADEDSVYDKILEKGWVIIAYKPNAEGTENLNAVETNQSVVVHNVLVDSMDGVEGTQKLTNAFMTIADHVHDWEVISSVEPTCENGGKTKMKCTFDGCDEKLTQSTAKLEHSRVEIPAVEPTCTESGLSNGWKCANCGQVITPQEEVKARGHHSVIVSGKAPTCTETGLSDGEVCSACGETLTEQTEIPAKGHEEVVLEGVAATCTTDGKTEGILCAVCGEVLVAQKTIKAAGHTEGEWIVVTVPSCTEEGLKEQSCTKCGEKIHSAEIPALGHVEETIPAVAPTCTEDGLTAGMKCSKCKEILVAQETINALGHKYQAIPGKAATCTEEGLTVGAECSVCGEILVAQEVIPAKEHSEVIVDGYEASCEKPGRTGGSYCSVCGEVFVESVEIPATGHTVKVVEAVAPTCTEAGKTESEYCSVCGKVLKESEVQKPTGHTSVVDAAVAATCTTNGKTEGAHCSVCGEILVPQTVIPATGHNHDGVVKGYDATCTEAGLTDGIYCTVCGETVGAQALIPALGHIKEWRVEREVTYDQDGIEVLVCTRCGEVFEVKMISAGIGSANKVLVDLAELIGEAAGTTEAIDAVISTDEEGILNGIDFIFHVKDTDDLLAIVESDVITRENASLLYDILVTAGIKYENIYVNDTLVISKNQPVSIEEVAKMLYESVPHTFLDIADLLDSGVSLFSVDDNGKTVLIYDLLFAVDDIEIYVPVTFTLDCSQKIFDTLIKAAKAMSKLVHSETSVAVDGTHVTVYNTLTVDIAKYMPKIMDKIAPSLGDSSYAYIREKLNKMSPQSILDLLSYEDMLDLATQAGYRDEFIKLGELVAERAGINVESITLDKLIEKLDSNRLYQKYLKNFIESKYVQYNLSDFIATPIGDYYIGNGIYSGSLGQAEDGITPAYFGLRLIDLLSNKVSNVGKVREILDLLGYESVDELAHHLADKYENLKNLKIDLDETIVLKLYNMYTVTFVDADGNVIDVQTVLIGDGATDPFYHGGDICGIYYESDINYDIVLSDLTVTLTPIHAWVIDADYEPTCTEEGRYERHCSLCDAYELTVTDALGHTEGDWVIVVEPTCTETGSKDLHCAVCDAVIETEEIPANGHTLAYDVITAATCTQTGSAAVYCSVCGLYLGNVTTDPIDHVESFDVKTEATCETDGYALVYCAVCNAYLGDAILPATGHDEVTVEGYAATCTENGLTDGVACSVCNKILVHQDVIPALGHTVETVPGYAATCLEDGLTDGQVCSVCGETLVEQEVIEATGHAIITLSGYAATCTTAGMTDGSYCFNCGEIFAEQVIIPATGHTVDTENVQIIPASCDGDGAIIYKCATCGEIVEVNLIGAAGHEACEEWEILIDATCGTAGIKVLRCIGCNLIMEAALIDPTGDHALEHIEVVGTNCHNPSMKYDHCSVCGADLNMVIHEIYAPALKDTAEDVRFINGYLVVRVPKLTVAELKANMECDITVYDGHGNLVDDDAIVGTNYSFVCGECGTVFYIACLGDVNGDGIIDALDYMGIKAHVLNIRELTGAFRAAADVNFDNDVDALDFLVIKGYCLDIYDFYNNIPDWDEIEDIVKVK